jgi:hypothetical protein
MNRNQKQVMDSFVRVRAFLDAHPTTGALTYTSARQMLDDVVQRLREHAGAQVSGRELSRAEVRRQRDQIALIYDRHMRPIVTIARSQIAPESDVGLPAALRMPRTPLGATKALAACDGMLEAARQFEAVFVTHGLPADFLAEFQGARDALERAMGNRATQVGTHVAARAGLTVELRRGRRAVDRLDAIVRASFRGEWMTLTAWRAAKRVHLIPGGGAARVGLPEEVVEAAA